MNEVFDDAKFHWNYGIVNNTGYLTFHIGWISFQIKIGTGNTLQHRVCYGNQGWSAWTNF